MCANQGVGPFGPRKMQQQEKFEAPFTHSLTCVSEKYSSDKPLARMPGT